MPRVEKLSREEFEMRQQADREYHREQRTNKNTYRFKDIDKPIFKFTSRKVPPHKYAISRFIKTNGGKAPLASLSRRVHELVDLGLIEEADQNDYMPHKMRGSGYRITEKGKEVWKGIQNEADEIE